MPEPDGFMLTREAHHRNGAGNNEARRKRHVWCECQNVEEHRSLQSLLPRQQTIMTDVPKFLVNAR